MTSTLVYDGDCAFCTSSVRWVARLHLAADVVIAWQHADLTALGLTRQQCEDALQLVAPDRTWSGHEAVAQLLLRSQWWWRPVGVLLATPPLSWGAGHAYRWVADHRERMPGGTPACALPAEQRPRSG